MRKIFFTLVLISFAFHSQAQLQLSPSTIDRPAILSTYNSAPFSIGMENTSLLHFSTNLRLGLGTRYLSNGAENFVNYAKFHIRHNSSGAVSQISGSPHLVLDEAEFGDYARLRFMNSFLLTQSNIKTYLPSERFWDIAGHLGIANVEDDRLNFFNSENGNILSITGDEKVGINDSSPERSLDINGTARVNSYTETGDESIAYKTKLISFTSLPFSCSGGALYNFGLGVNEDRVISADVLVKSSAGFNPPNNTFNNQEYSYRIEGNQIYFTFKAISGCDFASRGFRVWLTYSESTIASPLGNGPP